MQYATIVADPPWHYTSSMPAHLNDIKAGRRARRATPYATMSNAAIAALPVREIAARNAHLYLWTTNRFLEPAFAIARAWGFTPTITLVWCKKPAGTIGAAAFAISTEYVLFCRRGTLPVLSRMPRNWFEWPRASKHSKKPEHFLDMVESVSPGPYLEMFSRRHRLGWDVWGDQVESSIEVPA